MATSDVIFIPSSRILLPGSEIVTISYPGVHGVPAANQISNENVDYRVSKILEPT